MCIEYSSVSVSVMNLNNIDSYLQNQPVTFSDNEIEILIGIMKGAITKKVPIRLS